MSAGSAGGRIRFANQLRGLAAASVAVSHLVGVFWVLPEVVTANTFSAPQGGEWPSVVALLLHPWFNLGPLGVAVFFLISGFVVPLSLERHTRISFAVARLLRIYPTYVAALLLEVAVLYGASRAWGRPFTLDAGTVLANALLSYDMMGLPSIDLVNWTLSVELKFYLLAILLMPALRRGGAWAVLAAGGALMALNLAMRAGLLLDITAPPSTVSFTLSSQAVCLGFMLIGVAFNFHLRRRVSTAGLLGLVLALGGMVALGWRASVWQNQFPGVSYNYAVAIGVFGLLYAGRRFVPANPLLDGLAAVSFPFYVVHSLLGYVALRALMASGHLGYGAAVALTVPALLGIAAALHLAVERPSIAAGRRLADRGERPVIKSSYFS